MLKHEAIRDELIRQLESKAIKGKDVAEALGIDPARVTEMKNYSRRVQPDEEEPLARLLGMSADPPSEVERAAYLADPDAVEIQQWDIAYGMGGGTYLDIPVTGEMHTFSRGWLRQFTHAPPDKLFLATGTGDSMTPTIMDSDGVLIDTTQREVRMGDRIWAVAYGQTGLIKRLRPMPDGSVKILSDNPTVPPETAHDGEMSVVGRVVAIVRKM